MSWTGAESQQLLPVLARGPVVQGRRGRDYGPRAARVGGEALLIRPAGLGHHCQSPQALTTAPLIHSQPQQASQGAMKTVTLLLLPAHARALLETSNDDSRCSCCATRQIAFLLTTDTATALDYVTSSMEHGIMSGRPNSIPAGSTDLETGCFQSKGFMTGVEGTLAMSVSGSEGCQVGLYFDDPYLGGNNWHCETSCAHYSCALQQTNSDKNHPTLRVTVTRNG